MEQSQIIRIESPLNDTLAFPSGVTEIALRWSIAKERIALRDIDIKTMALLKTNHTAAPAKALKNQLLDIDLKINDLFDIVNAQINAPSVERDGRRAQIMLRTECEQLMKREEKIERRLDWDIAQHSPDYIRTLASMAGVAVALGSIAKSIWGEKTPFATVAELFGLVTGLSIVNREKFNRWAATRKIDICESAQKTGEDLLFYNFYVQKTVKDAGGEITKAFREASQSINCEISQIPARMHTIKARFSISKKPRP